MENLFLWVDAIWSSIFQQCSFGLFLPVVFFFCFFGVRHQKCPRVKLNSRHICDSDTNCCFQVMSSHTSVRKWDLPRFMQVRHKHLGVNGGWRLYDCVPEWRHTTQETTRIFMDEKVLSDDWSKVRVTHAAFTACSSVFLFATKRQQSGSEHKQHLWANCVFYVCFNSSLILLFSHRLKKNLKMFIIVHPSWFIRTLLGITRPFIRFQPAFLTFNITYNL